MPIQNVDRPTVFRSLYLSLLIGLAALAVSDSSHASPATARAGGGPLKNAPVYRMHSLVRHLDCTDPLSCGTHSVVLANTDAMGVPIWVIRKGVQFLLRYARGAIRRPYVRSSRARPSAWIRQRSKGAKRLQRRVGPSDRQTRRNLNRLETLFDRSSTVLELVEIGQISSAEGARRVQDIVDGMNLTRGDLGMMVFRLENRIVELERERSERLRDMREFNERLSLLEQIVEDQEQELETLRAENRTLRSKLGQYRYELSGAGVYTNVSDLDGEEMFGLQGMIHVALGESPFGIQAGVDFTRLVAVDAQDRGGFADDLEYTWTQIVPHAAVSLDILPRDMPVSIRLALGGGFSRTTLFESQDSFNEFGANDRTSISEINNLVGLGRAEIAVGLPSWKFVPFAGGAYKTYRDPITDGEVSNVGTTNLEATFGLRFRFLDTSDSDEPVLPFD